MRDEAKLLSALRLGSFNRLNGYALGYMIFGFWILTRSRGWGVQRAICCIDLR